MKLKRNLTYILNSVRRGNKLPVVYFDQNSNWGDALNGYIFTKASGQQSSRVHPVVSKHLLGIGSILSAANRNSIVVGSGFIKDGLKVKEIPFKILSVRGPKSRQALIEQGIDCPKSYGDLALSMPHLYKPTHITKKYKVGFIPHFKDATHQASIEFTKKIPGIYIIDIMQGIEPFIDDILSCEFIVSSSLHGLIASDAYQIPNCWVNISDEVIGGTFKFEDYYESLDYNSEKPLKISELDTIEKIQEYCTVHVSENKVDEVYEILISSCRELYKE